MFRKRKKKEFPPGTFIPTPARVMAIIQLTLALMVLFWHLSQPFMGDLFAVRSKMVVYEYVIGAPNGNALQQRNAERFASLPATERNPITEGYQRQQSKLQDSFLKKISRSLEEVLVEMPLFEKIWLTLSLLLPILILLKIEGAVNAAWLIPLVVFAYAVDNRWYGAPLVPEELRLFPSEEYLMEKYGDKPMSPDLFQQREQLLGAWHRYLAEEWSSHTLSADPRPFDSLIEEGEYRFTLARAIAIGKEKPVGKKPAEAAFIVLIYLLWNILFAYAVTKFRQPATAF